MVSRGVSNYFFCIRCFRNLKQYYRFANQCMRNKNILKSYLEELNSVCSENLGLFSCSVSLEDIDPLKKITGTVITNPNSALLFGAEEVSNHSTEVNTLETNEDRSEDASEKTFEESRETFEDKTDEASRHVGENVAPNPGNNQYYYGHGIFDGVYIKQEAPDREEENNQNDRIDFEDHLVYPNEESSNYEEPGGSYQEEEDMYQQEEEETYQEYGMESDIAVPDNAPSKHAIKRKRKFRLSPMKRIRYNCDVCQKTFSTQKNLKVHMMTHTDERPHDCNICGKKFRQIAHLNTHRMIHFDIKPFQCKLCGKSFRQRAHLKSHVMLHSDAKVFQCEICCKMYRSASNLRNHKILTHKIHGFRGSGFGRSIEISATSRIEFI